MKHKNKENITYGSYLNETYHRNAKITRRNDLIMYLSEGILILYKGNVFDLEEYQGYGVDDDGNPIK